MEQDARNSFRVQQAPYWCHRALTPIWLDDPGINPEFYETCWHTHVFNCGTENRLSCRLFSVLFRGLEQYCGVRVRGHYSI